MIVQSLAVVLHAGLAVTVWANPDGGDDYGKSGQTRTGVRALANAAKPVLMVDDSVRNPTKPGVRQLVGVTPHPRSDSIYTHDRQTDPKSDFTHNADLRTRGKSIDSRGRAARDRVSVRDSDRHARQAASESYPAGAYQWGGFGGFGRNGAFFGRPNGYRSFGYGYPWGSPYGMYYPYGFGFSPVAFGLSGPVTIRYEDPLRRQWKIVDDGIRRMAEGSGTPNP